MVKFECIDSGPGIPKTEQANLFRRFVQRGGTPGTGLGLAIAKHLVDLAKGTIMFESDPTVKAGTTCIVRIPLALCNSQETSNQEDGSDFFIDAPLRWLIVDDIKMNRVMLRRRLEAKICPNCIITEVATGEAALEICGIDKFDVIVVDQYMEEAGGVLVGTDVVYAMRRMRVNAIIIGCSGNDLEDEFREAGADWVWQKPMPSNKEIISRLHSALAEKHLA
jgi:CheY-like chemotaxis protein